MNETAIAIFAYVVAMFVAARLLSRLQFALATVLYLAAIAGCYMQVMGFGFILQMYGAVYDGNVPPLELEWWRKTSQAGSIWWRLTCKPYSTWQHC